VGAIESLVTDRFPQIQNLYSLLNKGCLDLATVKYHFYTTDKPNFSLASFLNNPYGKYVHTETLALFSYPNQPNKWSKVSFQQHEGHQQSLPI
jgi:hypothetical protein